MVYAEPILVNNTLKRQSVAKITIFHINLPSLQLKVRTYIICL